MLFYYCCDKITYKSSLSVLSHSLKVQSAIARNPWWLACGAAGETLFLVRKQMEMEAAAFFFLFSLESQPVDGAAHVQHGPSLLS